MRQKTFQTPMNPMIVPEWRQDDSNQMSGTTFYVLNSVNSEEELNIVSVYILDPTFNWNNSENSRVSFRGNAVWLHKSP